MLKLIALLPYKCLSNKRTKSILSLLIILLLLICVAQWLRHTPEYLLAIEGFSLSDWTITLIEKLNWQQSGDEQYANIFILFVFLSLATSIGLPRQIAAFVAGINLGAFVGVTIATIAATIGCFITFSVSRYLFSERISQKYPDKLATLSDFLGEQTFLKAFVIRILPIGSNFLTNIIAGVSKVSMPAFVGGSFCGFIPQMLIFSLAGSGIRLGAKNELFASAILFVIALLLSAYLVKKHKKKTKVKQDASNNPLQ